MSCIWFVVGIIAFAAVGHFLWWIGASILRAIFGGPNATNHDQPARPFDLCPACRANVQDARTECPFCGFLLDTRTARQLARVRAAEAEVRSLAGSGDLDVDTVRTVTEQLDRRARVLQGLASDVVRPTRAPDFEPRIVPRAALAPLPMPEPVPPPLAPAAVAATAAPSDSLPAPRPEPAARPGSSFSAFMEERNILWGELVGGLLIVGCSIALVFTLWQRLEDVPYFPFLLSASVTLALYGAGQYTLHHWKLTSTSRGLLVISLLLAPLDLLLLSDEITRGETAPLATLVKIAAVVLFAWVVRGGGRDVLTARPAWRWPLVAAVVGAPAALLIPTAWFSDVLAPVPAWLALGCFAGSVLVALRATPREHNDALDHEAGAGLLQFVGLAAFALAAAWGLHVARSPDATERVRGLALPLVLAAVPVIEAGLLVQRRARGGGLRTTGTGIALAGFVAMTGGLAAAWPAPIAVLLVSAAAGAFLTRVAFRDSLPWAQAGAIPAIALAVVVVAHGLAGRWSEPLAQWIASADTGVVLAGLALVLALAAEALARRGSIHHAASYAVGGAGVGFIALFLATTSGPESPIRAAAVHGACAAGLLAANARWQRRVAAHGGLWLVLAGSLWAMHAAYPGDFARWGFATAAESLGFAGLSLLLKDYRTGAIALLRRAGRDASVAAAIAASIITLYGNPLPDSPWATASLFTLALTGLSLARLTGQPLLTYAGAAVGALGFVHLAAITSGWEPALRALLVGGLTYATLTTLAAVLFRRQERVFARPLLNSGLVATVAAAALLLNPPASHAAAWAGCAVWLGLVWLMVALVWRDRTAFAGFQAAFSLAAVLGGVAWVARDPHFGGAFGQPAALHVYAIAVGLLGLAWVAVRWLLRTNRAVHDLWTQQSWSAERVVLAGVVVAQFLLAAWAVLPELRAELTPAGWHFLHAAPPELAQAFGPGAWVLLGVLTLAVVASWRFTGGRRDTDAHLVGLALLLLAVQVVWAGSHAADIATATALRWGLAGAFVVGTAIISARGPIRRGLTATGFPVHPTGLTRPGLLALLAAPAGVVVLLSVAVAELGLTGRAPAGPAANSPFAAMGPLASNLVPLALVVLGLAMSAARERSSGYAFAGGLVFTATVAGGYALGVVTSGGAIDSAQQIRIWLLASGSAAVWAGVWLAAERRVSGGLLLAVQSRLGLFALAWVALTSAVLIVGNLDGLDPVQAPALANLGQYGWLALAVATGAAVWRARRTEPGLLFHALATAATIAGVLAASAVQKWDTEGSWLAYHILVVSWAAVGVGLVVAVQRRCVPSLWLDGFALAFAVMAVRGGWHDPWRPWLPAGLAGGAAVLAGVSAAFGRSQIRVAISCLLVNLAAVLLWLPSESQTASGLLLANAAGLAIAAAAWTAVAIRDPEARWADLTDLGRGGALVLLAFGLAPTLAGDRVDSNWLTWGATIGVALSTGIALWDSSARVARGGLFAVGVAAVLLAASATTARPVWDVWQTPIILAGFAVLAAAIATRTVPFWRHPVREDSGDALVAVQGILAVAVVMLGVRIGLTAPALGERMASPGAILLLAIAAVALLRAVPARGDALRFAIAALLVLVPAAAAWAGPDPAGVAPWLQRNAWLVVALASAGLIGCEAASRLARQWQAAARATGGCAAALAVGALCANLVQQIPVYDPVAKQTPLAPAAVFAMLAAILGLAILAIRFALRRELDPLGMRDSRRTAYVYLAELLVVLFFTHIRFNVPELFLGTAVRYWTFAVMTLAFVGVGMAEYFERRKTDVLAGPLRRTGVLLPLIPLLAFWAKPPAALTDFATGRAPGLSPFLAYLEKLPQHFDTYAWLWFLAGGVYGLVALSRKSFGWALLAALATNAAMWSLLTHHEVPFFVHPQAWVIPLALIVLASEHVNRARLRPDVSTGLRHLGVTMIYVSSAADLFLAGVGESVWLPVILAVFCVIGVLLGIVTRVRSFVYLGVGFLVLDVFAMIWHAAVNLEQTWVWYVSGIVLGVAILALFAVFEKNKKARAAPD